MEFDPKLLRSSALRDITLSPGRYRLKPIVGGWATPEEVAASVGRIFVPSEGSAIRTVITGRQVYQTSVLNLFKVSKRLYVEGRAEKDYARLCEVDTDVVDFQTQAWRIECVVAGKRYVQIVDMVRELATGEIEVIEVKQEENDLKDPDYRRKLAYTGMIAAGLGWIPRTVLHREMFKSPLHRKNVIRAYEARFTQVTAVHQQVIRGLRDAGVREIRLSELNALLDPRSDAVAESVALALMVRREIRIDLTLPITSQSVACVLDTPQPPSGKIKVN